jgi:hypothetical protein
MGRVEDWRVLYHKPDGPVPWWKRTVEAEQFVLFHVVDEWLGLAGVRLSPGPPGRSHLLVSGGGLFGALVSQIAFAVSGTQGVAICSGCSSPYTPSRRPLRDRRRYCRRCRDGKVPIRDAVRDHRKRERERSPDGSQGIGTKEHKPNDANG